MNAFTLESIIASLLNPWIIFGFAAQIIFFARFIVQLVASERAKKVVVPMSFWYLSILGAVMILAYAMYRQDIVFIFGQVIALMIYVRNVVLQLRTTREEALAVEPV